MRAEVALLSRNILIYGEMEQSCYGNTCQFYGHDTFGGHVKVSYFSAGDCLNFCISVCLNLSALDIFTLSHCVHSLKCSYIIYLLFMPPEIRGVIHVLTKEVMFLLVFICLCVCYIVSKITQKF